MNEKKGICPFGVPMRDTNGVQMGEALGGLKTNNFLIDSSLYLLSQTLTNPIWLVCCFYAFLKKSFFFKEKKCIYLCLAALGQWPRAGSFSSCYKQGLLSGCRGRASPCSGFSCCGT